MDKTEGIYDAFAENYDGFYSSSEYVEEDRELMELLLPEIERADTILDCGCGTGLLWDYLGRKLKKKKYVGFDPSAGMIRVANSKHSAHFEHGDIFTVKAEDKYDLVLALYGVGAYMSPEEILRMKELMSENGRYFLMDFKEGYIPRCHEELGIGKEGYAPLNVKKYEVLPDMMVSEMFGSSVIISNFYGFVNNG
jgi:ubiquinone/menaquinone biosynthesis C-methylase UbiE